jgi:hypothetical protein
MNNHNYEFKRSIAKTLEFCSIERASRLLECEIEDIKHYISIGAIGAFVLAKNIKLPIDLVFQGIESSRLLKNAEQLFEKELTFKKLTEVIHDKKLESSELELSKIEIPTSYIVPEDLFGDESSSWIPCFEVVASGIWKVSSEYSLERIFSGDSASVVGHACDRKGIELQPETPPDDNCYWGNAIEIEGITISDVILIQHDLLILFDAFYLGAPLENIYNSQRVRDDRAKAQTQNLPSNKIHGNTVTNSLRRQEILEFAIYVKSAWPDQCKNAVKWAKLIEEKALIKWDTGEPPLSTRKIEEMLRNVVKDPVQIKSTS